MAEVTSQNLYNQLTPMGQLYYDQQFKKQYTPGQENILLSSQPEYEKMKAVFESEQQVPEKSFFDSINIFGSASAAEPDKINTVSNTPGFETIVKPDGTIEIVPIGTSNDLPFKSMSELAAENANLNLFPAPLNVSNFPSNTFDDQVNFALKPQPLKNLGFDTSFGVANEADVEQVDSLGNKEESGIMKLLKFLIPGSNIGNFLPKSDPRAINMRNFYGSQYGLTPTGSLASGIMKGYNPVSGGFLNTISGGKFGRPTQFGLANAARKRIEKIANRKAPQTDASRARIKELQEFARKDTANRARFNNPDVYREADKQGLTDPKTGGFKSTGTNVNFSNRTGRGRTGY